MDYDKTQKGKSLEDICRSSDLLYRDCNLKFYENRYIPGIVLREKGFFEAVRNAGRPVTTHRFAIMSSIYASMSALDLRGRDFCLIPRDSFFKILDVYQEDIFTVIILVHLPDGNWQDRFAEEIKFKQLLEIHHKINKTLYLPAISEYNTSAWLDRCSAPVGLDHDGNYYPLSDHNR